VTRFGEDVAMSTRRTPAPLLIAAFVIVVLLVIGSIATGQWWLTVLGVVALAAASVPLRNRR
jgi:hypothetical protein